MASGKGFLHFGGYIFGGNRQESKKCVIELRRWPVLWRILWTMMFIGPKEIHKRKPLPSAKSIQNLNFGEENLQKKLSQAHHFLALGLR